MVKNGGYVLASASSDFIVDLKNYNLFERSVTGSNKYVITERFSAPGGPETSAGAMDIESGEYSPYNALPFRNLSRAYGGEGTLYSRLTQHCGPFGFSSFSGHTGSWYEEFVSASYHKVNRNPINRVFIEKDAPPTNPISITFSDGGGGAGNVYVSIPQASSQDGVQATATFVFDSANYNSTDGASITLIAYDGTRTTSAQTFTINTRGSASRASREFDAGSSATVAAENFVSIVNRTFGRNTLIATNSGSTVTLTQGAVGTDGNTDIVVSNWDNLTSTNVGSQFSGGLRRSTIDFVGRTADKPFTILAWVKLTSAANAPIVSRQRGTYSLHTNASKNLVFSLYDSTNDATREIVSSETLESREGQTILLAATYDPNTGTQTLYLNAEEIPTELTTSGDYSRMREHSANHDLYVGGRNATAGTTNVADIVLDGDIENVVLISNEALDVSEVKMAYGDGYGVGISDDIGSIVSGDVVADYSMGNDVTVTDQTVSTVADRAGGNDGTPTATISAGGGDTSIPVKPKESAKREVYIISCEKKYDNYWVSHHIPRRNAIAYHWITSSALPVHFGSFGNKKASDQPFGCSDFTFLTASDSGLTVATEEVKLTDYAIAKGLTVAEVTDQLGVTWNESTENWISFMPKETSKEIDLLGGSSAYFIDYSAENFNTEKSWIQTDFVGLNTTIYEPITSSINTLGYPTEASLLEFPNVEVAQTNANSIADYHESYGDYIFARRRGSRNLG